MPKQQTSNDILCYILLSQYHDTWLTTSASHVNFRTFRTRYLIQIIIFASKLITILSTYYGNKNKLLALTANYVQTTKTIHHHSWDASGDGTSTSAPVGRVISLLCPKTRSRCLERNTTSRSMLTNMMMATSIANILQTN